MNNNIEKIVNDIKDIVIKQRGVEFVEIYLYENGFNQHITEEGVYYLKKNIKVILVDKVIITTDIEEYEIDGIEYDSWREEIDND